MTVLALDLSLTATGICDVDGVTSTYRTNPGDPLEYRLAGIVREVMHQTMQEPQLVVIEDFVTRSPAASTLGMVHGCVRLALWEDKTPFAVIPPAALKKYATGKGNATKADMRMALFKRMGVDLADDNQVDAFWLWLAGSHHCGIRRVDLPVAQLAALDKVKWPA